MVLSEVVTNYRTRRPQLEGLLKFEDQTAFEADLRAFFGKNDEVYVRHALTLAQRNRLWLPEWHWPAFLTCGFGWAFYRRLYPVGAALFVAQLFAFLIASNPRMVGFAVILLLIYVAGLIAFTLLARSFYVGFALNAIARANDRRIVAHKRAEYIAKLGGVSMPSGIGGVALLVVNVLLTIALSQPPV